MTCAATGLSGLLAILTGFTTSPVAKRQVEYRLRVDTTDLSAFTVEMRIPEAPASLRLGMPVHPEYDEQSWRFVQGLTVSVSGQAARLFREDSTLWRVESQGGDLRVAYRVRVPPWDANRAAWRPFLSPSGGLGGGPYLFLYVVGGEAAPATVTVDVPEGWDVATGLDRTSNPRAFRASSVDRLVDSPIFVGRFRSWAFTAAGVPHRVAYWAAPGAVSFDTAAFVDAIARVTREAIALFGEAPYRHYTFIFQDAAYGGLEHLTSAALGAPSAKLAADPLAYLSETAHEFFHAWNLMRIHPAEYRGVAYRTPERSAGLWFSEGLTMYYADALVRRAGLPTPDSTPEAHLAGLISRYLLWTGNYRVSPERSSLATYGGGPEALGDYTASVHLQGEVIGVVLDLRIRSATDGRRSMDDVMRLMMARFSGTHGFRTVDIETAVHDVCGCDVGSFFDAHVRGTEPIDFNRYLEPAGLHAEIRWGPAVDTTGGPLPDRRAYAWRAPGDSLPHLLIREPNSAWGRAGLHTGDRIVSVNGNAISGWSDWRRMLQGLRIGDTLRIEVLRESGLWRTGVEVTGYQRPFVTVRRASPRSTPDDSASAG